MSIEVILNTASAPAGLDGEALAANVDAEIEKLKKHVASKNEKISTEKKEVAAPKGAQDLTAALHWLIDFSENPALAKVYARGLIFAVNELANTFKGTDSANTVGGNEKAAMQSATVQGKKGGSKATDSGKKDNDKPQAGFLARIKVLGHEISLPAATAVIEEFLKTLN